jgi:hypothetical protein
MGMVSSGSLTSLGETDILEFPVTCSGVRVTAMKLETLLQNESEQLVEAAMESLDRSRMESYLRSTVQENRTRFIRLLQLLQSCVDTRNLAPMRDYARSIAEERFQSGYGLQEVFTAFNVLEEQVWKRIAECSEPAELAISLGLLGTVLGAGKESLSLTWVSLASRIHSPTLDLHHLFDAA